MPTRIAIGLTSLVLVAAAHAELRVFLEQKTERPPPAEIAGERVRFADPPLFLHRGVPRPARRVPEGGRQVPVEQALRELLPRGWTATVDKNARDFAVSWRGGDSWVALVRGIAYGLRADTLIDWARNTVIMGARVRNAWVLESGSLRGNLAAWARRAGWHFQWAVPGYQDLSVPYPAVLPLGLDIRAAVSAVVDSYRKQQVLNLKADLYETNLLIVLRCDKAGC